ncbi:hypothetical protein MY3296_008318 [Beauveria thailandica]
MTDRVATPYCGLCTFAVQAGETIVDGFINSDSPDSVDGDFLLYNPHNWAHTSIRVFHCLCYHYVGRVSPQLLALTQCDWTPTQDALADTRHGRLDMRKRLAEPPYRLPQELGCYITDYLVRYYHAAATAALRVGSRRVMHIDLSRNVWARFVKVHGNIYISTLSNTEAEIDASRMNVLLYNAAASRPADAVYVARDPWGVRQVLFARGDEVMNVSERADVWWDTIKLSSEQRYLDGQSDGLKLRRLTCKGKTDNQVSWPTPRQLSASFSLCRLPHTSGPIRLAHFRINEADTTGYHACLDGDTVAFRTPKTGYAAPRPAVTHGNWLYMPLNPGDWIREVWLRGRTSSPYRSAFIFVLNSGQVHVMGEHVRPGWEGTYWYVLLLTSCKNETLSLYADFTAGLRAVAISPALAESRKAQLSAGPSQRTVPLSLYPRSLPFENFCYAKASLEDVSAVAACCQADIDGQVIAGIVLRYMDGTEASLGWVAPDGLDSPTPVPDDGIWLCVSLSRTGFPRVTAMAFAAPADEDARYLRLRWRGELEWWFSRRQCQLHYNGELSAETKS